MRGFFIALIMFGLFSKNGDAEFALSMVDRLRKEVPASLMAQHTKILSVNKIVRLLERNASLAKEYHDSNKIGYFRRVKLINSYKWLLKEDGYSDEFIKVAVESLIVALAKGK